MILSRVTLLICFTLACNVVGKEINLKPKNRKYLDGMGLMVADFREGEDLQLAFHFIISRSRELDSNELDSPSKGIRPVIRLSKEKAWDGASGQLEELPADLQAVKVKYYGKGITVTTFLIEIARQTNLDLHLTSVGVVFCRPGVPPLPTVEGREGAIFETLFRHPQKNVPSNKPLHDNHYQPFR